MLIHTIRSATDLNADIVRVFRSPENGDVNDITVLILLTEQANLQ